MTHRQRSRRTLVVKPLLLLLIAFPVGLFAGGAVQLEFALW
jgi:hypothetical protein